MRSLKKYLPWHNGTIFIVTNNQIPEWLNIEYNKIKIVNHEEIIPKYINPTFDSSTIECFLDKIPGIGEIFIYLNDDFFFNNYVHPAFFFNSESFYPKIFRTREEIIDIKNVEQIINENDIHYIYGASIYFTNEIIKKYFDNNFKYYNLAHNAYVCYTSFFEPFRQFFKEELKVVFSHRFRCAYKPITLYLYQMLLLYANEKLKFNSTLYYQKKLIDFQKTYFLHNNSIYNYSFDLVPYEITKLFVQFSFINDDSKLNYEQFIYLMKNRNILLYNINDKYNNTLALYEFTEYMITRYPENNTFEKDKYVELEKQYLYKLQYVNESMNENNDINRNRNKRFNYFNRLFFNENNINFIKEYIEEKKKLSVIRNISKMEEEEIKVLYNYKGKELGHEWEWVKNISIVYIIAEEEDNKINQLKYSLRSIAYYLPWFIGTIYIIVQSMKNDLSWLNFNNSHIKIINPNNIVSRRKNCYLSKEIIEMYLDKIPDISERFLYLNPNHYFKNFIHPRFFFDKEFFPKYNFASPLCEITKIIKDKKESFFKTYEAIKVFFGNNYINNYRALLDSPLSLYRDLFSPVRKLYISQVSDSYFRNFDLLPMYLISTYNIYGASQIYFPKYVAGFGKIRTIDPPSLRQDRIISYYGFDITSEIIFKKTILNLDFSQDITESLNKIKESNALFFSFENKKNYKKSELNFLSNLLENLYDKKSFFEI